MRFTIATGTPAEQRDARGAHVLMLDSPLDLAPAVKDFMPYLDWGDQGGVTTLSYEDTMACIGRFLKTEGHRDLPFLGRLPSDGVLSRLWQSIMGAVQDKSACTAIRRQMALSGAGCCHLRRRSQQRTSVSRSSSATLCLMLQSKLLPA